MGMFYHNGLGVLEDAVELQNGIGSLLSKETQYLNFILVFYGNGLGLERIVKKLQSGILKLQAKGSWKLNII